MSVFVRTANLPHSVESVLIGERYADELGAPLNGLGVSLISVPDNPLIDARLSGHCDLSIMHGGGELLFSSPLLKGSEFSEKVLNYGAKTLFLSITQGNSYPNDAQLNIAAVGDYIFYTPYVSSPDVIKLFVSRGLTPVAVRQGYAKCSVCVVSPMAIITADSAIARAAENVGLGVLLISPGYIELPGFDYGFIGGSAFKLSDAELAFTGSLDLHPDKRKIFDFLAQNKVIPVFLTNRPIFDIGGAIPLTEKAP